MTFDSSSSEGFYRGSAPATSVPMTFACWFKPASLSARQTLIGVVDTSGTKQLFSLGVDGSGKPEAGARDGTTYNQATSSLALSTSPATWYHLVAVFETTTKRRIYVDGVEKGSNTVSTSPTGLDTLSLAYMKNSTQQWYADGDIYLAAIWDKTLTDGQITDLAGGLLPPMVEPGNLVTYVPFFDDANHDLAKRDDDSTSVGFALTKVGTPVDHQTLPSQAPYVYTWPMVEASQVPGTSTVHSMVYAGFGSSGLAPSFTTEPPTTGRKCMKCDASAGANAHSEFFINLQNTGLHNRDSYLAFDFEQLVGGTYAASSLPTDDDEQEEYVGRYVRAGRSQADAKSMDIRHCWDGTEWSISPSVRQSSPDWTQTYVTPDWFSEDQTRRTRVMVKFHDDGSDGDFTLYREKYNGTYLQIATFSSANNTLLWWRLRARAGPDWSNEGKDPEHTAWFSNIAVGVDIDDVWDARSNTTGSDNNPITPE